MSILFSIYRDNNSMKKYTYDRIRRLSEFCSSKWTRNKFIRDFKNIFYI